MLRIPLLLVALVVPVIAVEWRPIEKAELERAKPKLDPDAAAEVIFWDVKIEDRVQGDSVQHLRHNYIRIKLYSDSGREKYGKGEVTYGRKWSQ